jgi:PAS domain S-box-containing protein
MRVFCGSVLILASWGLVEYRYFGGGARPALEALYVTRSTALCLLTFLLASWLILRERRRHKGELEQACDRYRSILDNTPEAVVLFDDDFRVAEWNRAAERLYGIERQEAVGKKLTTIPIERWNEIRGLLGRLSRGQQVLDYESERLTAAGDRVPVALGYARVPPIKNQPPLYLEIAQDIRVRLQMRDKLLEIEKLTLMGHLAAGTAHHLNTPLTAMLLQTEMLRLQLPGAEEQAELASIEGRIRFCQGFVQNLLCFARCPELEQKRVSFGGIVKAAGSLLRPSALMKKASLEVDADDFRDAWVLGDSNYLEAALSALVSNAIDAIAPRGSVHIHGHIEPGAAGEIYIDDDGPGVPEDLWPSLFLPFFTTKPAGQGTGLGLPIAKNIVERHGGTLQLQNRTGRGLRATVSLPMLALCSPGEGFLPDVRGLEDLAQPSWSGNTAPAGAGRAAMPAVPRTQEATA